MAHRSNWSLEAFVGRLKFRWQVWSLARVKTFIKFFNYYNMLKACPLNSLNGGDDESQIDTNPVRFQNQSSKKGTMDALLLL